MLAIIQPKSAERSLAEFPYGMTLSGSQHEVFGYFPLKHQPHAAHIIRRVPPVPRRVEIAQLESPRALSFDFGRRRGDLPGHKLPGTTRAFMIKKNPAARKNPVVLPVSGNHTLCEQFGDAIGIPRAKWRQLCLRRLRASAIYLAAGSLKESNIRPYDSDCLEDPHNCKTVHLSGENGLREEGLTRSPGRQIVHFLRPVSVQEGDETFLT